LIVSNILSLLWIY